MNGCVVVMVMGIIGVVVIGVLRVGLHLFWETLVWESAYLFNIHATLKI